MNEIKEADRGNNLFPYAGHSEKYGRLGGLIIFQVNARNY